MWSRWSSHSPWLYKGLARASRDFVKILNGPQKGLIHLIFFEGNLLTLRAFIRRDCELRQADAAARKDARIFPLSRVANETAVELSPVRFMISFPPTLTKRLRALFFCGLWTFANAGLAQSGKTGGNEAGHRLVAAFSGPLARNVPNAQGTMIFWLTAMGHLHMFRALPAGRTVRHQGERSSAGRATDF